MKTVETKDGLSISLNNKDIEKLQAGEEMILIYSDKKQLDNKPTLLMEWHTIPASLRQKVVMENDFNL
jgi:hypothetical protein